MARVDRWLSGWLLAVLALLLAGISPMPFAGGWNDGSRLATSDSLLSHGTLAIDDSIFTKPPPDLIERGLSPYTVVIPILKEEGTVDKVYIKGHFYSDKPMLPAVATAAAYRVLQLFGLPDAAHRPDTFCEVMTFLSSGVCYAIAVVAMWGLGWRTGLKSWWRVIWMISFALATVLPAYTRQVNGSIHQVAAVAAIAYLLARLADAIERGKNGYGAAIGTGLAAGIGYSLDLGSGPLLFAATALAVSIRTRRMRTVCIYAMGAMPGIIAHHALNYYVTGGWVPPAMVPEFLNFPGGAFDQKNMTGVMHHNPVELMMYSRELLISNQGILVCNLPLMLAFAFGWLAFVSSPRYRIEQAILVGWCIATWVEYSLLSNNLGGGALSIRWFIPFLVPGYWMMASLLTEWRTFRADFVVLTSWGFVLAWWMWQDGPWLGALGVNDLWPVVYAGVGCWGVVRSASVSWWAWRVLHHGQKAV